MRTQRAWICVVGIVLAGMVLALPDQASAQQGAAAEERLREALRRTTLELRSLQDATAGDRAALDEARKQREVLQQTVDQQQARIAELEAQAAGATVLAQRESELTQLRQDFATVQSSNEQLLQGLKQWQQAYEEIANLARAKDAERRQAEGRLAAVRQTLGVCQEKNERLGKVAGDVLDLYQSRDFRRVLLGSFEPVLGLQRVDLENILQDYQDKVLDEHFLPAAGVPAAASSSSSETPPQ